jgi:hypothetical protein
LVGVGIGNDEIEALVATNVDEVSAGTVGIAGLEGVVVEEVVETEMVTKEV